MKTSVFLKRSIEPTIEIEKEKKKKKILLCRQSKARGGSDFKFIQSQGGYCCINTIMRKEETLGGMSHHTHRKSI